MIQFSIDDDDEKEKIANELIDTYDANNNSKKTAHKPYVGKKEDEEWLKSFEDECDEGNGYNLLVQNMGIFRWQSVHGFRTGQYRALTHIKAKFKNIKELIII